MNKGITEASHETGDAAASFSRMRQRIAAEPSRPLGGSVSRLLSAIGQWLPATPAPQWAIASVGGLLLAFVLLLQTDMMGDKTDDSYRVLSSGAASNIIAVSVSFDKDATAAESEAALTAVTSQMSLDSTWVTSGDGNYELSVNASDEGSTISPPKK